MISSLVPKLVLCGLLVLALSFKVSVGMRPFVAGQDEMVRTSIVTFLGRHGFEPDPAIAIQNPIGALGRSGGCQLLIAEVAYQGWQRDYFAGRSRRRTNSFSLSGATSTRTNPSG